MSSLPRTSGIYRILCTANGKIYIGSTSNFERRWKQHCHNLKLGKHPNPHLQRAYIRYGDSAFVFDVLEVCEQTLVIEREQYYLDTLKPFRGSGFNIALDAKSPMLGRPLSEAARTALKIANTGRYYSPETRAKISASKKGTKASDETRAKLSVAHKGRKHTPEAIAKMVTAKTGLRASPETRAKLSAMRKGRIVSLKVREASSAYHKGRPKSPEHRANISASISKNWVVTSPNGVEIKVTNLTFFCYDNGLLPSMMGAVASGKRKHHHGWLCRKTSAA